MGGDADGELLGCGPPPTLLPSFPHSPQLESPASASTLLPAGALSWLGAVPDEAVGAVPGASSTSGVAPGSAAPFLSCLIPYAPAAGPHARQMVAAVVHAVSFGIAQVRQWGRFGRWQGSSCALRKG